MPNAFIVIYLLISNVIFSKKYKSIGISKEQGKREKLTV